MKRLLQALALLPLSVTTPALAERPVVLELFTSQGCSSCPPADALLTELARQPDLMALSMHINYWDYLGWQDPYASAETTGRQRAYAHALGHEQVFTPELVVDGRISTVGSNESAVKRSVAAAKDGRPPAIDVSFSPGADGLAVDVAGGEEEAEIWLLYFDRATDTKVEAGENGGRRLASTNVVTSLRRLGSLGHDKTRFTVEMPAEGVAVIVQAPRQGPILGAGSFLKPSG